MLKPTAKTLLSISCIALLSLSTFAQGIDPIWCPKKDSFYGGDCGNDGSYQCFLDFLGMYGASRMPKNCSCQSLGPNQRSCQCSIVCNQFPFAINDNLGV